MVVNALDWKKLKNLLKSLRRRGISVTIEYNLGNNSLGLPNDYYETSEKIQTFSCEKFEYNAKVTINSNEIWIPYHAEEINKPDKGVYGYEWSVGGAYDHFKIHYAPF